MASCNVHRSPFNVWMVRRSVPQRGVEQRVGGAHSRSLKQKLASFRRVRIEVAARKYHNEMKKLLTKFLRSYEESETPQLRKILQSIAMKAGEAELAISHIENAPVSDSEIRAVKQLA